MKKVIEDKNLLISGVKVGQEVNDEKQRIISYIKDELQISIEKIVLE